MQQAPGLQEDRCMAAKLEFGTDPKAPLARDLRHPEDPPNRKFVQGLVLLYNDVIKKHTRTICAGVAVLECRKCADRAPDPLPARSRCSQRRLCCCAEQRV